MESAIESPEKADTVAQPSPTLGDANTIQTDTLTPKAPITSPNTVRLKPSTKRAHPLSVKRAASTPNVRTMAGAEEALSFSVAEKRRNKLGYHRTSVACGQSGHCRRRKIRCLLAPDYPQGKCQNCIRLKKDCNFFPIEQHLDLDDPPRSDSRLGTFSSGAGNSESSSPSFTGSRVSEHIDDPSQRLQHLSSPAIHQDVQAVGTLSRSLTNPPNIGQLSTRTYGTSLNYGQNVPWTSSSIQQSPPSAATDRATAEELSYWRHGPPMPTNYSQHPYSTMHSSVSLAHSPHSTMEQIPNFGHGDFHSWSAPINPPLRSTSLVGPDEVSVHSQNLYYETSTIQFHPSTNTSNIEPPTFSSNSSTMSRSDQPLSLPGMEFFHDSTAQHVNFAHPPSLSSVQNQSSQTSDTRPDEFTHGWYSDPSALAQVKEEEAGSQFHYSTLPDNLAYQANPG